MDQGKGENKAQERTDFFIIFTTSKYSFHVESILFLCVCKAFVYLNGLTVSDYIYLFV